MHIEECTQTDRPSWHTPESACIWLQVGRDSRGNPQSPGAPPCNRELNIYIVRADRTFVLWLGGVALCSVTIIRVWLKVLEKTFVMVK